jgi:hypothetical protein
MTMRTQRALATTELILKIGTALLITFAATLFLFMPRSTFVIRRSQLLGLLTSVKRGHAH